MSVSLAEIVAASRRGDTSFVAESAGYVVLGLADGALRSTRSSAPVIDGWTARLDGQGDLISGGTSQGISEAEIERSLRGLLAALLLAVRTPSPNLNRVAERHRPTGLAHLVVELEAALVPVNRKAARRSLARLCRETQRSLQRGDLVVPPLLHADAEAPVARNSDDAVAGGEVLATGGSVTATGMPPRIHSALAPVPVDELDIEIVVEGGGGEGHPVSEASVSEASVSEASVSEASVSEASAFHGEPLELSAAAPRVTALDFEDTPAPILAAAASPPSQRPREESSGQCSGQASEGPANVPPEAPRGADFTEPFEPFELSAPAPPVRALVPSAEVPLPEVPSLDVVQPTAEEESHDETPTRVWARVAPLDVALQASEVTTLTDWSVAAETEVTAAYDLPDSVSDVPEAADLASPAEPDAPVSAELASTGEPDAIEAAEPPAPAAEPEAAVPSDSAASLEAASALDLASALEVAAEASPPAPIVEPAPIMEPAPEPPPPPARFPRLSRRPPSDVAELLARHGGARKTDENELLEGLGRLAELERSIG